MTSKKWIITMGLAVVLVVALVLPACPEPKTWWHTPEGEKISFVVSTRSAPTQQVQLGSMIASMLQEVGLDVSHQTLDPSTFVSYMWWPPTEGIQAGVTVGSPGIAPLSDWIWTMSADPDSDGYGWNNTWFNNATYNEFYKQLYRPGTLEDKLEAMYGMQEVMAEELNKIFLVGPAYIFGYRTDKWGNWQHQIQGPVSWLHPWTLILATPLGEETAFKVGVMDLLDSTVMNRAEFDRTTSGCLHIVAVYEGLAQFPPVPDGHEDQAFEFWPALATDYSVSMDGDNQVWTVDLREGAKWHDGQNFTAHDVEFTIRYVHHRDSTVLPVDWDQVEADGVGVQPEHMLINVVNNYTIEFTYTDPMTTAHVPNWWKWNPIVPEHIFGPIVREEEGYEQYEGDILNYPNNETIGTGPFRLKEFVQGNYLLWERNDDWWGGPVGPTEIFWQVYGALEPALMALEAGEVDYLEANLPFARIEEFEAKENIAVRVENSWSRPYLFFNLYSEGPLQDKALRQAIAHALDRQLMLDIVYGGYGNPLSIDSYMSAGTAGHNADLRQYEFSSAMFESIMTAAGYYRA